MAAGESTYSARPHLTSPQGKRFVYIRDGFANPPARKKIAVLQLPFRLLRFCFSKKAGVVNAIDWRPHWLRAAQIARAHTIQLPSGTLYSRHRLALTPYLVDQWASLYLLCCCSRRRRQSTVRVHCGSCAGRVIICTARWRHTHAPSALVHRAPLLPSQTPRNVANAAVAIK